MVSSTWRCEAATLVADGHDERPRSVRDREAVVAKGVERRVKRRDHHRVDPCDRSCGGDLRRLGTGLRAQILTDRALEANPGHERLIGTDLANGNQNRFTSAGLERPHIQVADVDVAGMIAAIRHVDASPYVGTRSEL